MKVVTLTPEQVGALNEFKLWHELESKHYRNVAANATSLSTKNRSNVFACKHERAAKLIKQLLN